MKWLAVVLCLGLSACQSVVPSKALVPPISLDAARRFYDQGQYWKVLELLAAHSWEVEHNVEIERLRQNASMPLGLRWQRLREIRRWQDQWPNHPDLAYLQARMMEDPMARAKEMERLFHLFPQHPWIWFGHVTTVQELRRWNQAENLLTQAGQAEAALPSSFRHLLYSRQARHKHQWDQAFQWLEEDAFQQNRSFSMWEYLRTAVVAGDQARIHRARAAMQLQRQAPEVQDAVAIDLAFQRFQAEWPWCREESFQQQSQRFDQYLAQVGAPHGWAQQPRYGWAKIAGILRPEAQASPLAQAWLQARRALLAGYLGGQSQWVLLQGCDAFLCSWPGSPPLQILIAENASSVSQPAAEAGTVFRGFYLLRQPLREASLLLEEKLRLFSAEPMVLPQGQPFSGLGNLDLSMRLRKRAMKDGDWSVYQRNLWVLCLHESGHLPDVLPLLDNGGSFLSVLPDLLKSQLRFGNPRMQLEYEAQLRALATGVQTDWLLAETLDRATDLGDPYFAPYRQLMKDLVNFAVGRGWPPLARWQEKSATEIAQLARDFCQHKVSLLPVTGIENLKRLLIEQNFFE